MPENAVKRRIDEIYEVMDEMAEITIELDRSSWSYSRRECVGYTYLYLQVLNLHHGHIGSRIRALGRTFSLSDLLQITFGADFELRPPLYLC